MATDQPYNSLGQILSQGGEIALGLALAYGWSDQKIAALFARRFEPMSADDRDRLLGIATAAVNAADLVNAMDEGGAIGPGDLPVNPQLFGDESGGKRALLVTEFSPDQGANWYEVRLTFADLPSLQDIQDALQIEADRRIKDSPSAFSMKRGDEPEDLMFRVTLGEARF